MEPPTNANVFLDVALALALLLGIALVVFKLFRRQPPIEAEFATRAELSSAEHRMETRMASLEMRLEQRLAGIDAKRSEQIASLHEKIEDTALATRREVADVREAVADTNKTVHEMVGAFRQFERKHNL